MNRCIEREARGDTMRRWRTLLGWSSSDTARRLSITTRTLSSDEGGGVVPDARWRLFLLEVSEELRYGPNSGGLVIIHADDGFTLLDVVSYNNFAGFVVSADGVRAIVASYTADHKGEQGLHRQTFVLAANPHARPVLQRWEQLRIAEAGDSEEAHVRRWIMRMSLATDLNNPDISHLKQKAQEARERLLEAEPNTKEYEKLFDENEAVVAEMFQAMSKKR
ncbi:hypothetical protein LMG31886_35950 [Xanthomonas hydrangeae]|nr:hypothetical protein LMG31885_24450 [Xanthomonas hydrangeae]CAD7736218.1 hypothetical protein LMG31885_24450 [Xanthomonas hydrangeae]CAD7743710.1 hypothetical protein LMG31886_35950 [Xanthomonas hydrangeae]CAD7743713.1 hypothetical protein LMG31886_35950 [Xanthomonas hydrangeae]